MKALGVKVSTLGTLFNVKLVYNIDKIVKIKHSVETGKTDRVCVVE
jgi:hypothetical protein